VNRGDDSYVRELVVALEPFLIEFENCPHVYRRWDFNCFLIPTEGRSNFEVGCHWQGIEG
jgi:hypothetical protein